MKKNLIQLLRVESVRYRVAWLRYFYFVRIRKQLRMFDDREGKIEPNTIAHNLKGLTDLAVNRSNILVRPLSVIEELGPHTKILSIGPRTEGELLNLRAYGFAWKNIRGLDLISYSPRVDLGDMHQMPYENNSWDAIIAGWVLAYSNDRKRAAREMVRVLKNGGIVALGVEYAPESNEEIQAKLGYLPGNPNRATRVRDLLDYFEGAVDRVYFSHDIAPHRLDKQGSICVIFSIKK